MNEEENEKKVLNNAVNNYTNKRAEFLQLVDFLNETGSDNFRYLTFLKNDRISCTVFADSNYAENLRNNIPTSIAMVPDFQGITLLPDNRAKIMYADTFIVLL